MRRDGPCGKHLKANSALCEREKLTESIVTTGISRQDDYEISKPGLQKGEGKGERESKFRGRMQKSAD